MWSRRATRKYLVGSFLLLEIGMETNVSAMVSQPSVKSTLQQRAGRLRVFAEDGGRKR
jgi:hypothetical protein